MALLAAHGRSRDEIAKEFGVDATTVYRRLNRPEVLAMMEEFMLKSEAALADILVHGEKRAAETLVELLASGDDDVRYKAAVRLGDMAGSPGKPAEKVEMKQLHLSGNAADVAFANALRDPAVRAYLAEHKQTAAELRKYLPEGAEIGEVLPAEVEETPPNSEEAAQTALVEPLGPSA